MLVLWVEVLGLLGDEYDLFETGAGKSFWRHHRSGSVGDCLTGDEPCSYEVEEEVSKEIHSHRSSIWNLEKLPFLYINWTRNWDARSL